MLWLAGNENVVKKNRRNATVGLKIPLEALELPVLQFNRIAWSFHTTTSLNGGETKNM
jgi:hypothetical protein